MTCFCNSQCQDACTCKIFGLGRPGSNGPNGRVINEIGPSPQTFILAVLKNIINLIFGPPPPGGVPGEGPDCNVPEEIGGFGLIPARIRGKIFLIVMLASSAAELWIGSTILQTRYCTYDLALSGKDRAKGCE